MCPLTTLEKGQVGAHEFKTVPSSDSPYNLRHLTIPLVATTFRVRNLVNKNSSHGSNCRPPPRGLIHHRALESTAPCELH